MLSVLERVAALVLIQNVTKSHDHDLASTGYNNPVISHLTRFKKEHSNLPRHHH
jgi:hypothetical protein